MTDSSEVRLDPRVGFVTSAACYTITMPSEGSYQVDLSLVDDIDDGRPPIETLIGQDGGPLPGRWFFASELAGPLVPECN